MTESVITVRPAELAAEADAVGDLMVEYMTWATQRFRETFGFDAPTDPARMRENVPEYGTSSSALLVAVTASGELAGAAALKTLEPGILEIKRMYVRPAWRGRHVGSRLLDQLLDEAARLRASTVRLDSARFMHDAQSLYRSRGFTERDPYQGTEIPPDFQQYWVYFERSVSGGG